MRRTTDEGTAPFRYRPLPSVDIALLPHELRAIRMQRLFVAGAVVSGMLLLVGLAYGRAALRPRAHEPLDQEQARESRSGGPDDPMLAYAAHAVSDPDQPLRRTGKRLTAAQRNARRQPEQPLRRTTASTNPTETSRNSAQSSPRAGDELLMSSPEGENRRVEYKFGRARSFHDALLQSGASAEEANELIGALRNIVDFRRCKPEDRFVFERGDDQELQVFEYRSGITEIYRALRDEDGSLHGVRVEIPVERRRVAKGTFVAGTLGHSLDALGLGTYLAGTVTGAFDARISFTRDTRAGDSVKIILDEEYVDGVFLRHGPVHAIEYTSERAGKLQAFWFEADRNGGEFYDANGRALHGGWLRTPVRYDHVSSPFNLKRRHPILKRIMPHLGIDYSASTGTPVWAAADGVVSFAGPRGANGNLVSVRHGNGYESHYAHLWKIGSGIKPGTKLEQRAVIGFVGSTGRSTGPHLHFALKRNGHFLDPVAQLNGPGEPLPSSLAPRFQAQIERLRDELEHVEVAAAPNVEDAPKVDEVEEDDDLDL